MEDATTIKCRIESKNQTSPAISSNQMDPDEPGEEPRATTVSEPDVPQADQVPGPSRAENAGSDNFDQGPQPSHEPGTGQLAPEERSESRTGIPEEGEHQPNGSLSHIVPTQAADPRDPPEDEFVPVNDIEPGEEGDVMPSGYFAPPEPYDGERQPLLNVRHSGVGNDAESDSGDLDTIVSDVRGDNTKMQYDFLIYHEEKDTNAAKAVKDDMTAYFCNRNIPPRIALIDDFHYEGLLSNQLQAAVQRCTLAMFYVSENTKDRRESMVKELNTLRMMSESFNGCIEGILIIGHGNLDQMSNCLENDSIYVRMTAQITRGYFDIDADDFLKKMYEWYIKYNRSTTEREQLNESSNAGVDAPVNPDVYQPLDYYT